MESKLLDMWNFYFSTFYMKIVLQTSFFFLLYNGHVALDKCKIQTGVKRCVGEEAQYQ